MTNHPVERCINPPRGFSLRSSLPGAPPPAAEPPLLLAHVPLLQVPAGCVNVHGHVHEKESPSRNRHVNVSVEQLNYRPARLCDIRRLALRLLEGRTVPERRTRERLNVVEATMP